MQMGTVINRDRRAWDVIVPVLDAAAIVASLAAVRWASRGEMDEPARIVSLITVVIFLLVAQVSGFGRRGDFKTIDRELLLLATTWTTTVGLLALLGFTTRWSMQFSRLNIASWILVTPAVIGLSRVSLRILHQGCLRRGYGVRRVAIVTANRLGKQIAANIATHPTLGLRSLGFFDDRDEPRDEPIDASEIRGDWHDLLKLAKNGEIDNVLVTLPMRAEGRIQDLLDRLSDSTVSVYIVPDFFVFELLHCRWTNVGGLPAVSVFENPLFGIDGMFKRLADIVLATIALAAAAVPMIACAIAVKWSSPGPVFFRQKRYGLDGREILVWKFRSMRSCDNGPIVKQATKGDPRVTRVGAILRRTSLDELPQLFNVLEGSMSLVGPRPHATAHNEEFRTRIRGYMLRHKVKPGITGLAQVNGCRGETQTLDKMQRRVDWDHRYIRSWSLWLDLKILFMTLLVAWRQEEAY